MNDPNDISPQLLRNAWILFSDLNARFNILAEECCHLQDTVAGLLERPLPGNRESYQDPDDQGKRIRDFKRKLETWSLHSNKQRSLRNLYNYLGSLSVAFENNQKHVRGAFVTLCKTKKAEDFFWFCAQRDFFVNRLFSQYTELIQHAHVKLIQMLENGAGSLPQSILLRRWNSALYGEFLAAYSRHVDWETHLLSNHLFAFEADGSEGGRATADELSKERKHNYFIHSWTHVPTSRLHHHKLSTLGKDEKSGSFSAIKSAFFYLEMPFLFPLLYHECAHTQFDAHAERLARIDIQERTTIARFFRARSETAERLREEATRHQSLDDSPNFWEEFTGEVWADTVAITLGGAGYLAALSMQTFGQTEGQFFRDDQSLGLDDYGNFRHRIWDLDRQNSRASLWDARLRTAIMVYRFVYAEQLQRDGDLQEWLASLEGAIDLYYQGGQEVFAFSVQHKQLWVYRRRWSDVITGILQQELDPQLLRFLRGERNLSTHYELTGPIAATITEAINGLYGKVFGEGESVVKLGEETRIEELSLRTKWAFSRGVAGWIEGAGDDAALDALADVYANYVRNDGNGAFRLALEWLLARDSLLDQVADFLAEDQEAEDTEAENRGGHRGRKEWIRNVLGSEGWRTIKDKVLPMDPGKREKLWYYLKSRTLFNTDTAGGREDLKATWPPDVELLFPRLIEEWVDKHVVEGLDAIGNHRGDAFEHQFRDAAMGTFSIGVLHPKYVAEAGRRYLDTPRGTGSNPQAVQPLKLALEKTRNYFAEQTAGINARLRTARSLLGTNSLDVSRSAPGFIPLIGQYSFALYDDGVTPAEKRMRQGVMPELMIKPRAVVLVHGGCRSVFCEHNDAECSARGCRPHTPGDILSISLIKFSYRVEVFELRKRLRENWKSYPAAKLFLSSGWEDCILVLRHESETAFWNSYRKLDLGSNRGCENVQTYLAFDLDSVQGNPVLRNAGKGREDADPSSGPDTARDCPMSVRSADGQSFFRSVYERSGRYDCTVKWNADTSQQMAELLCMLPADFWDKVEKVEVSTEQGAWNWEGKSNDNVGFYGQISLRGRRWC